MKVYKLPPDGSSALLPVCWGSWLGLWVGGKVPAGGAGPARNTGQGGTGAVATGVLGAGPCGVWRESASA